MNRRELPFREPPVVVVTATGETIRLTPAPLPVPQWALLGVAISVTRSEA